MFISFHRDHATLLEISIDKESISAISLYSKETHVSNALYNIYAGHHVHVVESSLKLNDLELLICDLNSNDFA